MWDAKFMYPIWNVINFVAWLFYVLVSAYMFLYTLFIQAGFYGFIPVNRFRNCRCVILNVRFC